MRRVNTNKRPFSRLSVLVLLTSAALVPVIAFSGNKAIEKTADTPKAAISKEYRNGFAGSFLSGNFAKDNLDLDEASHYSEQTLQASGGNTRFVFDSIRAHLLAGHISKAQKLAETLPVESRKEPMVALLLTVKYLQKSQFDKALATSSAAHERGLLGVVKPAINGWLALAKKPSIKSVISMQEAIDRSGFFAPFLHYQQALMYDMAGGVKNAQSHFEKASESPQMVPYRVATMLIKFYLRQGQNMKAEKVASAFNAHNENPAFTIKLDSASFKHHDKEIVTASHGMAELFFTTASILFGDDASIETLAYLRMALHLRPNFAPAQFLLAHVYEQQRSHERALVIYNSIRPGSIFYERSQIRKALNLSALGRFDEANDILDKQAALNIEDITALVTMGDLLREKKHYAQAADVYSLAIDRANTERPAHWSIYYARGICYERNKQWSRAEKDFLTALAQKPNQPDVLNYLSYSWLLLGKNLNKAREYLQIAVTARPDDAHIIDSFAWAHYVSGDFEQAVKLLERAVSIVPYDSAINGHLGDAYWRVGRALEARYQWRRALRQDPEAELKRALEIKLSKGLAPFLSQTAEGEKKVLKIKPKRAVSDALPKTAIQPIKVQ